jgi:hypothetical protein
MIFIVILKKNNFASLVYFISTNDISFFFTYRIAKNADKKISFYSQKNPIHFTMMGYKKNQEIRCKS